MRFLCRKLPSRQFLDKHRGILNRNLAEINYIKGVFLIFPQNLKIGLTKRIPTLPAQKVDGYKTSLQINEV